MGFAKDGQSQEQAGDGNCSAQEKKGRSGSKGSLHQRGERSVVAQMDTGAQKMHHEPRGRAGFTGRKE